MHQKTTGLPAGTPHGDRSQEADGLQMRAVKSSPAAVKGEGSETFFEDPGPPPGPHPGTEPEGAKDRTGSKSCLFDSVSIQTYRPAIYMMSWIMSEWMVWAREFV